MTNEPNKRFPRVSACCNANTRIYYGGQKGYEWECIKCNQACDVIADEGLRF